MAVQNFIPSYLAPHVLFSPLFSYRTPFLRATFSLSFSLSLSLRIFPRIPKIFWCETCKQALTIHDFLPSHERRKTLFLERDFCFCSALFSKSFSLLKTHYRKMFIIAVKVDHRKTIDGDFLRPSVPRGSFL